MSKNLPETQPSEEVDLGQIFKLIGNAFDRLFRFIGSIFSAIYKLLLLVLIHIHRRKIWYAGAVIIGLVAGYVLDKNKDQKYSGNMFVETNYSSSRQVYEVIKDLNQLANIDKDTLELSSRLGLSLEEAGKLKEFNIEPDIDENNLMKLFVDYKFELDSVSRLDATFKDFKKGLATYSYKTHKIEVVSTDKGIFKKLSKQLLAGINSNEYLTALNKVTLDNLNKREEEIDKETGALNALKEEYLKIRIKESEKESSAGEGTNVYMGDAEKNQLIKDEISIVTRIYTLENEKQALNKAKVLNKSIVNVISDFPNSGYIDEEWYSQLKIVLPIALVGITLFCFIFLGMDKFLKKASYN